jgi:hypothetical protein
MRKSIIATLGIGAVLALSACGGSTGANQPSESASAPQAVEPPSAEPVVKETPTPTPEPADDNRSDRGNLIAKIGDTGSLSDVATGSVIAKFTVNAITPVTCTEPYAQPLTNGNAFTVDITLQTTKELAKTSNKEFYISAANSFKFIAANGTTFNGDLGTIGTYSCIPEDQELPSSTGPAEKVRGKVVLDLPAKHGILVMDPSFSGDGFEYKF